MPEVDAEPPATGLEGPVMQILLRAYAEAGRFPRLRAAGMWGCAVAMAPMVLSCRVVRGVTEKLGLGARGTEGSKEPHAGQPRPSVKTRRSGST